MTAIAERLRMMATWARRAEWATEEDTLLHDITLGCTSEHARFRSLTVAERLEKTSRSATKFSLAEYSSLEEFIATWKLLREDLHDDMAWAIVAQEDVETAAVGRLVRASYLEHTNTKWDHTHTVWVRLFSQATGAGWADDFFEAFDETYRFHRNLPSYRASLFSTIVSTMFDDHMINVDALDDLLGLGYTAQGVETRLVRDSYVRIMCRTLQQRGADLVPKEVLGLLAVVSMDAAM